MERPDPLCLVVGRFFPSRRRDSSARGTGPKVYIHCTMRLGFIGKRAHRTGLSDMIDIGRKPSQVLSLVF